MTACICCANIATRRASRKGTKPLRRNRLWGAVACCDWDNCGLYGGGGHAVESTGFAGAVVVRAYRLLPPRETLALLRAPYAQPASAVFPVL